MTPLEITFHKRFFKIFHDDPRFIHEVLIAEEYKDIFNDLVVLDVGANIGAFSFWIYDHARIIYAIEPSEKNYQHIKDTASHSNLDKIKPYLLGISGTGGDRHFNTDSDPSGGGWKIDQNPVSNAPGLTLIPTKTILDFLDTEGIPYIDVMKIDIEGAEKEVFQSEDFRKVAPRIHSIIGEFHSYDPTEDLENAGYRVRMLRENSHFVARKI